MMKTQSKIQLAMLVLLMIAIPYSAYGVDGQIKIGQTASTTFPIEITQSGSYVLTSNLTVSTDVDCIQINVDNVTIDLNGYSINGPESGSSRNGIYADGSRKNITIKNGVVQDFAGKGIFLDGNNNEVSNIKACNNGGDGISVKNSIVINCIINSNGGEGIYAIDSTITNCTASHNSRSGIYGISATITNCSTQYNNDDGIHVFNSSTVTNCTAKENNDAGIHIDASTLTNCTVYDNQNVGIDARGSTIKNCTSTNNGVFGISAIDSIITNCTVNHSGSTGITASHRCHIEGNNLRWNGGFGFHLGGQHNYVIKNSASNNTSGNFQDNGSNNYMPTTGDNANYGW